MHGGKLGASISHGYNFAGNEEEPELNGAQIAQRVPSGIYYSQTIGLFTLQMLCAVLIDDITIIFGFFAAISESTVNFILPGLFYLCSTKLARRKPNIFSAIGSYLFIAFGVLLFFVANYNNYLKITAAAY